MMKFPVNLKYGSSTHCTLKYASMKQHAISEDDLVAMFPKKFTDKWYARRAMETLAKHGYVKSLNGAVQITPLGDAYLGNIARRYIGEFK